MVSDISVQLRALRAHQPVAKELPRKILQHVSVIAFFVAVMVGEMGDAVLLVLLITTPESLAGGTPFATEVVVRRPLFFVAFICGTKQVVPVFLGHVSRPALSVRACRTGKTCALRTRFAAHGVVALPASRVPTQAVNIHVLRRVADMVMLEPGRHAEPTGAVRFLVAACLEVRINRAEFACTIGLLDIHLSHMRWELTSPGSTSMLRVGSLIAHSFIAQHPLDAALGLIAVIT
jgi:hypothetical protein